MLRPLRRQDLEITDFDFETPPKRKRVEHFRSIHAIVFVTSFSKDVSPCRRDSPPHYNFELQDKVKCLFDRPHLTLRYDPTMVSSSLLTCSRANINIR